MAQEERRSHDPDSNDSSGATAWWVAIGVLVVIAGALYAWKVVAVNQAEDRLEQARAEWRAQTERALEERTRTLLKLSAEPLGLAVRDAAMQENYGTVGSYLDRIAGIEGVEGAVLAVGDTIRVSTDATQAGRALSEVVPGGFETGGEARVVTEDGTYRAAVPITGLNERIGTLVLTYVPADPGVDVADEAPGEDESPSGSAPADTAAGE